MPQRIQRQRTKGWRMSEGAVYVGRPSKWGNPWVVHGNYVTHSRWGDEHYCEDGQAQAVAVRLFREDVLLGRDPYDELDPAELRGKDLVCWCAVVDAAGNRVPCHADVLLELANGGAL